MSGSSLVAQRRGVRWAAVRRGAAAAAVLAAVAWFCWPILSMTYTEGFQPSIVIDAYAIRHGDVALADPLYPFDGRFFTLTRLGTSLAVSALGRLGAPTGLAAFYALAVISLAVLLGSVLGVLRRFYRVGPVLGLLCCLLFPPVFESAYLPNDDLPSAALTAAALLLFWARPSLLGTVGTGLLLGFAALFRLDAVLLAPAFAILLVTEVPGWPARAVRACIAGALVVAVPWAAYRLCGLSLPDTFSAVGRAVTLWDRPVTPLRNDMRTLLMNVTLAGGVAWLLGVLAFARARRWRELLLAAAVPVLYVLGYRGQLTQGRYLLPLAPFVLPAMAVGLRSVAGLATRWRIAAAAALAVGFLVWVAPPMAAVPLSLTADADGPRLLAGRFWNPLIADWWNRQLAAGQSTVAHALDQVAASPDPVIVTGYWNGDRLVTALLLERGFTPAAATAPEACRGIAEAFVREPVRVLQIRTHVPFLNHHNERLTWESVGLPCLQAATLASGRVFVVGSGTGQPETGPLSRPPLTPWLGRGLPVLWASKLPVADIAAALGRPPDPGDTDAVSEALRSRAEALR